jgi:hypothetical protein
LLGYILLFESTPEGVGRPYSRTYFGGPPRNGDTRVIVDKDKAQHPEFFMNSS